MNQVVRICPKRLEGAVKVPPSKSMAHRAVICASLAEGESVVRNIQMSQDIAATISSMEQMGAVIKREGDTLYISKGNADAGKKMEIDCNESGSTLRFLIPVSMLFENEKHFTGRGNLGKRPLDVFYEIFDRQGIVYSKKDGVLDLNIKGRLSSGDYPVKGDISSQFISGLMFALPLLDGESRITITTKLESRSYLDLTLKALSDFGIEIKNDNYHQFIIPGNQKYRPGDYTVEGDYSQAAFFLVANYLGSDIDVRGLDENSLQGDREIIHWLDVLKNSEEKVIDAANCPDIIPVLTVAAALTEGKTRIINAERLRIKECDRLSAITEELTKMGADITEYPDSLEVTGVKTLKGATVSSHNDHRIAMSMAIAATRADGEVIITDPYSINKSYPSFYEDFVKLGGKADE